LAVSESAIGVLCLLRRKGGESSRDGDRFRPVALDDQADRPLLTASPPPQCSIMRLKFWVTPKHST